MPPSEFEHTIIGNMCVNIVIPKSKKIRCIQRFKVMDIKKVQTIGRSV